MERSPPPPDCRPQGRPLGIVLVKQGLWKKEEESETKIVGNRMCFGYSFPLSILNGIKMFLSRPSLNHKFNKTGPEVRVDGPVIIEPEFCRWISHTF